MGGDGVHQRWRQAVVGFQTGFAQLFADARHLVGRCAGFNDGKHERCELGASPTGIAGELGVDEIEAVKRVVFVFDAAKHVHAAGLAGVALDRGLRVNHLQFFGVRSDMQRVARDNTHDGKNSAAGLPAFAATAGVVVGNLGVHAHLDGVLGAMAFKGAAREVGSTFGVGMGDGRAQCGGCHGSIGVVNGA